MQITLAVERHSRVSRGHGGVTDMSTVPMDMTKAQKRVSLTDGVICSGQQHKLHQTAERNCRLALCVPSIHAAANGWRGPSVNSELVGSRCNGPSYSPLLVALASRGNRLQCHT